MMIDELCNGYMVIVDSTLEVHYAKRRDGRVYRACVTRGALFFKNKDGSYPKVCERVDVVPVNAVHIGVYRVSELGAID